jgi:hypothetical protein
MCACANVTLWVNRMSCQGATLVKVVGTGEKEFLNRVIEALAGRAGFWGHVAAWAGITALVPLPFGIYSIYEGKFPASTVLGGVVMAAVIMAALGAVFGAVSFGWERYGKPRLQAWASSPRSIVKAVLAVAVVAALGALWWRFGSSLASLQHLPAAVRYPAVVPPYRLTTPPTFYNLGIIIIVVVWMFLYSGVVMRSDPLTLNLHRVGDGAGGLAVVAFVLHSAANDVGGFGNLLAWFKWLPQLSLSPMVWLSLAALAAVAGISTLRLVVGLRGPFLFWQKTMLVAKKLAWLAFGAGLWLWGVFLPDYWWGVEVFKPAVIEGANFAIMGFYLFTVTSSAAALAVLLFRGGGNPFEGYGPTPHRPVQGS